MTTVTVDASAALAWLFDESRPEWIDGLLREVANTEVVALVPSHFWLEVGNALCQAGRISDEQAVDGLLRLDALGFETVEVGRPLRLQALQLARQTGLTIYDATYLAVALASDATLATLDARLRAAAASHGSAYAADPDGADEPGRVSDLPVDYGRRAPDPVSLAAIGAVLADLRSQHSEV